MEKEFKVIIPEGFEVDKEKSTFEKIVFKPIDLKPKSWEEYCNKTNKIIKPGESWYNQLTGKIDVASTNITSRNPKLDKEILPSKEYAEAFLAMMQLISLRQAWIGDWEPDWNGALYHYCIIILDNKCTVDRFIRYYQPLSFPTKEMALDFMNTFKDLIEIAKPLI